MLKRISDALVNYQIRKEYLKETDRELYEYAYEILVMQSINIAASFIVAAIFCKVIPITIFLMFYIPLRIFAGGNHAKTNEICSVISICIIIGVCIALNACKNVPIFYFTTFETLAGVVIFFLSPVEDCNKPLDRVENRKYKKTARKILLCQMCFCFIISYLRIEEIARVIVMSHILLACALVIGEYKNRKRQKSS
ncbi:MAG: accessory gene regulator B family protein [Lachnospiraceae bacterium]|nr:accessory gene regulator B family protein [Lachnospiraceae bacterium]